MRASPFYNADGSVAIEWCDIFALPSSSIINLIRRAGGVVDGAVMIKLVHLHPAICSDRKAAPVARKQISRFLSTAPTLAPTTMRAMEEEMDRWPAFQNREVEMLASSSIRC